jgi:deoxyribonuclease-4
MIRLGVHVPIAGGLLTSIERAARLSCTTMQIFSRSPRGGAALPIPDETAARFDAQRRAAGIDPVAVHSLYIINLASPDAGMWNRSLALYRQEYARVAQLKAQYLVTHVGSHMGSGEAAGIAQVSKALNRTLESLDAPVMILLENTAGSGQGLGSDFEQLAAIRGGVEEQARVGVCLDTAHLFAAGLPIHTAEGLDEVIADFDRTVGLSRLRLIHLNDSKVPFNSRVDRHWHIGEGKIGLAAFRRIVNHPALREVPFILETPKTSDTEDLRNLAVVRKLSGAPAPSARRGARQAA